MPITPQPGIMQIALYKGGQSTLPGHPDVLKLSSNESPWGPSPEVGPALAQAAQTLNRYPSTDHAALRAAIAEVYGLDAERVICGVGSDEVLQFAAQCYAGPGDEVIYTEHGFAMYPIFANAVGAAPVKVAERERRVDVDAILAACTERTALVFVTNPGNPTGTTLPEAELVRLAEGLPERALLIVDGAYDEFAAERDVGLRLAERDNVLATRTFSKLFGLGGLRIGWGYGPAAVIEVLNRVRQPFNLSQVQLAAAEAAVRDQAFAREVQAETLVQRARLTEGLQALGIACDESEANFVLARFADEAEAGACDEALREVGIIVRRVTGYGFPEALRMTVGRPEEVDRLLSALSRFKGAA
ncbi:histidinol-phosphate transaminase [Pseudoroseicyclus aestuarii]|uniref:Histidinol-phosphate aminotransferase n=1 Tax=Pseudoroseicyclus aestuarii TaxID=1795041 RepID=A0A318SNZ6_9RHOB|nr:histidinol-phosphate transaminase [Pseudoroseicyclus aestuarii]PYE82406.1 histidinol-phosphate aminotransferase [Pseudoroseicyclus aestuarii]